MGQVDNRVLRSTSLSLCAAIDCVTISLRMPPSRLQFRDKFYPSHIEVSKSHFDESGIGPSCPYSAVRPWSASWVQTDTSCCRPIFFLGAAHRDLESIIRQWLLERLAAINVDLVDKSEPRRLSVTS